MTAINAAAQIGAPATIAYGYVRGRGNNVLLHQLANKTRIAFILLGQGEWTGIDRFWINNKLVDLAGGGASLVRFHPGTEGELGHGLTPDSSGGDQRVDLWWNQLPANIQRVTFSRWAYIALYVAPDPAAPGPDLDWLGDYRALKVRQFDAAGAQTAYAFSTNPAWQITDLLLRSVIKRWSLVGEALTAAEKARFDFASLADSAAWCDADIGGGVKRMETSVVFADRQNLAARVEHMERMSQLYVIEAAGKVYIRADKPRAYSFLLTSDHILAGSFQVDKRKLRGAANRHIGHFNDLNLRQIVAIAAIARAANVVTVQTSTAHPFFVGDDVSIGAVAPAGFNGDFGVASVADATHFTYAQTGANESGAGGSVSTPESRFAQRAPIVDHQRNQLATGTRGVGLTTIKRRLPEDLDYGNNTWERVKRLMKFRSQRSLGIDVAPYMAPLAGTVKAFVEAVDAGNNILIAQLCGDIVRIDPSISEEFQGDYEIMEMTLNSGGGENDSGDPPHLELTLLQYLSGAFSDAIEADTSFSPALPRNGLDPVTQVDGSGNTSVAATDVEYSDGATVDSLQPAEADAERTAGKSLTLLADRNLDNIGDSPVFLRTPQYSGDAVLENGNFEASGSIIPPPGYGYYGSPTSVIYDTTTQYSGSRSIKITNNAGVIGGIAPLRRLVCRPGDTLFLSVRAKAISGTAKASISFRAGDGSGISGQDFATSSASWTLVTATLAAPAGTVYATFELFANDAGGAVVEFDEHYVRFVRDLETEVRDSANYKRLHGNLRNQIAGNAVRGAQNLLYNPAFEAGSAFWTPGAGISFNSNSANAHTGAGYFEVTSSVGQSCVQADENGAVRYFEISPEDTIYFGGWIYLVSFSGAAGIISGIVIQSFDANKTHIAWHALPKNSGTGAWEKVAGSFTPEGNAKYAILYCEINGGGGTPGAVTARFDDVWMRIVGNLDTDVADGSTYGRPLLARLNAGKPWIDFSEGIHGNKNLDNIANGASRKAVAEVDANNRAIVDLSAGHYNRIADYISETGGRKWAAESGADITGSHTASNTNNVGARTASTIASVIQSPQRIYLDNGVRRYSLRIP